MLWQGKVLGNPEAVKAAPDRRRDGLSCVGLEAGATSERIGGHLVDEGFPVVCLESRHIKAALSAMTVKTDRSNAHGIAQVVRTDWFKTVHLKSAAEQQLRTLTAARKAAVRALTGNEQVIRGLLPPLDLKIGAVTRVRFETRVRQLVGTDWSAPPAGGQIAGRALTGWPGFRRMEAHGSTSHTQHRVQASGRAGVSCRRDVPQPRQTA
jgi:transposase